MPRPRAFGGEPQRRGQAVDRAKCVDGDRAADVEGLPFAGDELGGGGVGGDLRG